MAKTFWVMHNKRSLIAFLFTYCIYFHAQGQIDIANLDPTQWEIDTINQSLVIKPNFIFGSDTIIKFYDSREDSKTVILTLRINERRRCLSGKFIGTKEYPNSNRYLITNYGVEKIDSLIFINIVDSVIYEKGVRYYFIDILKLGLSENDSFGILTSHSNLILMGSDKSFQNSTYNKSYETVVWEEKDPPYLTKSTLVIRDALKSEIDR